VPLCEQCYRTQPGDYCTICGNHIPTAIPAGEFVPELTELFGAIEDWTRDRTLPTFLEPVPDTNCPRCGLAREYHRFGTKDQCICPDAKLLPFEHSRFIRPAFHDRTKQDSTKRHRAAVQ